MGTWLFWEVSGIPTKAGREEPFHSCFSYLMLFGFTHNTSKDCAKSTSPHLVLFSHAITFNLFNMLLLFMIFNQFNVTFFYYAAIKNVLNHLLYIM